MFENLRLIKDEKTSEIFNANKQNKKDKKWKEKKKMNFLSVFYTDSLRDNFFYAWWLKLTAVVIKLKLKQDINIIFLNQQNKYLIY